MDKQERIKVLKEHYISDWDNTLAEVRSIMKVIGKNAVVLKTTEPINGTHYGTNGEFVVTIREGDVVFPNGSGLTVVEIMKTHWFNAYIYTVEMRLWLERVEFHLQDSIELHLGGKK